jgi:hypothetical protein
MLLCVKTAVSSVALCASFPAPEMFGGGGRGAPSQGEELHTVRAMKDGMVGPVLTNKRE